MLRTDRQIHQVKDGTDQAEAEESGADQHGYGDDHFQCIGKTGNDRVHFSFMGILHRLALLHVSTFTESWIQDLLADTKTLRCYLQ